jgi:hypothetical protein
MLLDINYLLPNLKDYPIFYFVTFAHLELLKFKVRKYFT